MKTFALFLAVALYVSAFLAVAYGWISNVVTLIGMLGGDVTAMFIARLVGVFVGPLGVVLGYVS